MRKSKAPTIVKVDQTKEEALEMKKNGYPYCFTDFIDKHPRHCSTCIYNYRNREA